VGEDAAALPHRDVVRRVEAHRGEVAKGADGPSPIRRAHRVATVLDQIEIVLLDERRHGVEIERIAEGVRDHHGARALA
jgi:hypothetical protein